MIDPGLVADIVNRFYRDGDSSLIAGQAGALPLVDRKPPIDQPEALANRAGAPPLAGSPPGETVPANFLSASFGPGLNSPILPARVQIFPDPDATPAQPSWSLGTSRGEGFLPAGTGTGAEGGFPAIKGPPRPIVEIPMVIPSLPATLVTGSGNPTFPGGFPGNAGVSDGPAAMASSGPSAPAPGDIRVPAIETPAVLLPPATGAYAAVPPAQISPTLAGDPTGTHKMALAMPSAGRPGGIEEAPSGGNRQSRPAIEGEIPSFDTQNHFGYPYFLSPAEPQERISPAVLDPSAASERQKTFFPTLPGGILGLDPAMLTSLWMGESAATGPRAPAVDPEGGPYFIKERREPLAVDEPRLDQGFDMSGVREDFPILHQNINGKPLVWLDNAATSQKPRAVIEALKQYYETINSNVHRGAHTLATRATDAYEGAREKVQRFIGADSPEEIVFVRGTTEAINLIANSYGRNFLAPGDEVVVTTLEHHSNIVPWLMLRQSHGIIVRVAPVDDNGDLLLTDFAKLLGPRTKLAAFTHVSNAIGTVMPVHEMTALAHSAGARVLIDGAQSVPHFRVNVRAIDADFYVFSGHKVFAPTGIGVLFGRKSLLDAMPPWQGGGSMIDRVSFDEVTYNKVPYKFEAGTPIIGPAVGLGAALDYLEHIGFDRAAAYERSLMAYALRSLGVLSGVRIIGNPRQRAGSISLIVEGIKTEEMGKFLDREGIAVRAGHHCAQPALRRFGLEATVRPSLAFYNTVAEIDRLVEAILKAQRELK